MLKCNSISNSTEWEQMKRPKKKRDPNKQDVTLLYVLQHLQISKWYTDMHLCLHEYISNTSTYMTTLNVHLHDEQIKSARLQIASPLIDSVINSNHTKCWLNGRLETRSNGLGSELLKLLLSICKTKVDRNN